MRVPTEYIDGTQLAPFADAAVTSGAVRPFIAVMPAAAVSAETLLTGAQAAASQR